MNPVTGARILVVDDEPAIRRAVITILSHQGFQVEAAETGEQALAAHANRRPDLILLDLGLPDIDGLDLIKQIRGADNTPIVVLSVRGAEHDKVAALNRGADDYLTKPFGVEELLARIRVALRHAARPSSGSAAVFRTGSLQVDLEHRRVTVDGTEVHLSRTEYDMLKAFITHPNKVLTYRML
ncbi:MAG: response regulator transcription factor, partial [Chloroflexi bacterium]|nr:response regulator transcription factor [Chloroflexota bacterium]